MPGFLTPVSDTLPKFLTTWGILIAAFSMVSFTWVVARLFEALFSAKERAAILMARVNVSEGISDFDKQSIAALETALVSAIKEEKKAEPFMEKEMARLQEVTEKRFERLETLLVDKAKHDALLGRIIWLKRMTIASTLIFGFTFLLGTSLTLTGYREWRIAEKKADLTTKPNAAPRP